MSEKVSTPTKQTLAERTTADLVKAAMSGWLGTALEFMDFQLYSLAAALVFSELFFPKGNPGIAVVSAMAIYGVGYVARPIGAWYFGRLGDRIGRKKVLYITIALMGVATTLIGFLPTYQQIGLFAPILLVLLRLIQGFGAGAEIAGASVMLAEYAPPRRRGIISSLVALGTNSGTLFASLVWFLLVQFTSEQQLIDWGWRIPFFLSGPLGLIGRYIRVHLEDSPAYQEMRAEMPQEQKSAGWSEPLRLLFRDHRHETLITFGVSCLNALAFYMLLTYMPTYAHQELGFSQDTANFATSVTLVCYIVSIFLMGHMSDSFGRRRMLISACIAFIVVSIPLFVVMTKATTLMVVILCQIVFAIVLTANDGTLATFLAESFPTNVRYSGFALSFNGANALLGGTTPFVLTWLIKVSGSSLAPAVYLTVIALIAMVAIFRSRTIHGSELTET